MSHELFLILHKVRGEPAFDIAQIIGEDSDGNIWVIPTSGHRAYPYWFKPLNDLCEVIAGEAEPLDYCMDTIPDSWPDHYKVYEQRVKYGERVNALLKKLGLNRKNSNLNIRPL